MVHNLNPYLALEGTTRRAMQFYQSILGGDLTISTYVESGMADADPDLVMHAQLVTAKGQRIMASDTMPGMPHRAGDTVALSLSGDDEDLPTYFDRLAEGGQVTVPFEKQMWGDEYGQLRDKFGVVWHIDRTIAAGQ